MNRVDDRTEQRASIIAGDKIDVCSLSIAHGIQQGLKNPKITFTKDGEKMCDYCGVSPRQSGSHYCGYCAAHRGLLG